MSDVMMLVLEGKSSKPGASSPSEHCHSLCHSTFVLHCDLLARLLSASAACRAPLVRTLVHILDERQCLLRSVDRSKKNSKVVSIVIAEGPSAFAPSSRRN